jgi:hypothetical protein
MTLDHCTFGYRRRALLVYWPYPRRNIATGLCLPTLPETRNLALNTDSDNPKVYPTPLFSLVDIATSFFSSSWSNAGRKTNMHQNLIYLVALLVQSVLAIALPTPQARAACNNYRTSLSNANRLIRAHRSYTSTHIHSWHRRDPRAFGWISDHDQQHPRTTSWRS